jgi:chromosome segregation ATPase
MKKLLLILAGLGASGAFIGTDAVHAFVDKTRAQVRSTLMSPEMELQTKLADAQRLGKKCADSVVDGRVSLARLDAMIRDRETELTRREAALERDRLLLAQRKAMLEENRPVYRIRDEEVTRQALNRDALLRARAFASDRDVVGQIGTTVAELKAQRAQTAAEIEEAAFEQGRLETEVLALRAELENLKARKAVARTREEAAYVFDRSAFDEARDKIAEIRASIAEQQKRLDFYGRTAPRERGLIPAEGEAADENGLDAINGLLLEAPAATLSR